MKKSIIKKCIFLCLTVLSFSCQENELFELSPNAEEANLSYENQFKAIWTAIDINYPIWDYERDEYGLNWDDIYNEYLPIFREYDVKYKETGDSIYWHLVQLEYWNMIKKLHDGHMNVEIKDVYSGKKGVILKIDNTVMGLAYTMGNLIQGLLWERYKNPSINGYTLLEHKTASGYRFGHFNSDVAYLRIPDFNMSNLLSKTDLADDDQAVIDVWQTWFDRIQELQKAERLKGVILDVRNNLGGNKDSYQYFLGALHGDIDGNNTIRTGQYRTKIGIGRYDYGYMLINDEAFVFKTYGKEHVIVTAPIVVLADSLSASMAEQTCLAAKKLPNAYVIGTNTYGAFSPLTKQTNDRQFTSWGEIGDIDLKTSSFYIKMPFAAFVTDDDKVIEGKGVEPDEFVLNDDPMRDKQLEYALDFIQKLNK